MSLVTLTDVTHRYPSTTTTTVDHVSLTVSPGELVTVYGSPKSGKSTLLRIIHGMERPVYGKVEIGGVDVTNYSPAQRGAMMAFDSYALYPNMTLRENMEFALQIDGVNPAEITRRTELAARLLGFLDVVDENPHQVSGPVRQSVALARAMVRIPAVLLVDEPLAKLADDERTFPRGAFVELQRELDITALVSARKISEALEFNSRTIVLDQGRLTGSVSADELSAEALQALEPHADASVA